jgi:hypothetical protein
MSAHAQGSLLTPPLSPDQQRAITSKQLARLIINLLIRNDQMPPEERNWKITYYPYDLAAIRQFEIVGHANPEVPEFARKWSTALALLESRAFVMLDPSQDNRHNFMLPTEFATPDALKDALGE